MVHQTPKAHLIRATPLLEPPLLRPAPTQMEAAPLQMQRQRSASRGSEVDLVSLGSFEAGSNRSNGSMLSEDSGFVLIRPSSTSSSAVPNHGHHSSGILMPRSRAVRQRDLQERNEMTRSMWELRVPSERELLSISDIEQEIDSNDNSNPPGRRWRLKKRIKHDVDESEDNTGAAYQTPAHIRYRMKFPVPDDLFFPDF